MKSRKVCTIKNHENGFWTVTFDPGLRYDPFTFTKGMPHTRARVHFVMIQNRETYRGRDHVVFDNGVGDGNGEYIYALIPINGDDAPEFRIKQAVKSLGYTLDESDNVVMDRIRKKLTAKELAYLFEKLTPLK